MPELSSLGSASSETSGGAGIDWRRLIAATALTAIIAAVASAAVYLIASASGAVDRGVVLPSLVGNGPLSLTSVCITAVVVTVLAASVYGGLGAMTRRPVRNFRIVATVLAALSLAMPLTTPGPPTAMRLTLVAMHAVVWMASVGVLATLWPQSRLDARLR